MRTPTQLSATGAYSAFGGARRPAACPAFRSPQVSELPLWLEPVVPHMFGGLVGHYGLVHSSTTHVRGTHS
jgi:hypothetical protein